MFSVYSKVKSRALVFIIWSTKYRSLGFVSCLSKGEITRFRWRELNIPLYSFSASVRNYEINNLRRRVTSQLTNMRQHCPQATATQPREKQHCQHQRKPNTHNFRLKSLFSPRHIKNIIKFSFDNTLI